MSARECELWAGNRIQFPIDFESLPGAIGFADSIALSLTRAGGVIAFGQLVLRSDERGHLGRIIVAPRERRHGHGKAVVRNLLERSRGAGCKWASLCVDRDNAAAIGLYEKLGFRSAPAPESECSSSRSVFMEVATD
jgi:ribosomal protein S18 acetylase RimI-like enzyme